MQVQKVLVKINKQNKVDQFLLNFHQMLSVRGHQRNKNYLMMLKRDYMVNMIVEGGYVVLSIKEFHSHALINPKKENRSLFFSL